MKKIRFISIALIVCTIFVFGGCRKKTASESGENIVKIGDGQNKNYEVVLDERDEDTQYQYGEDDLSFIDTVTGKKIAIGMSKAEVEEIAGEPELVDRNTTVYDGIVITYYNDVVVMMSISNGYFEGEKGMRYSTSRGIHIGSSVEDFKKAYGADYRKGSQSVDEDTGESVEIPSRAERYFKKDGRKIEFLGTGLTSEIKEEDPSKFYMQDYMFSDNTGNVVTMRVSLYSAVTGGLK